MTNLILKPYSALPFLEELIVKRGATRNPGVIHLGDAVLYSETREDVNPMIYAADCNVKTHIKPSSFHSFSFSESSPYIILRAAPGSHLACRMGDFIVRQDSGGKRVDDCNKEHCN